MQSDKSVVQDLIAVLTQRGLRHAVVSPGSRHAPVSLSLWHHPDIELTVIPDERAAGYFALGIAQYTGQPVALVCTSGTALSNYGPAAAEAFYQQLPLIFISADRPAEWVDQGDGQTIRQSGLLDLHVRASFDLRQDDDHHDIKWYNRRMVHEAWEAATSLTPGPVHLNIGLREPLYQLIAPQRLTQLSRQHTQGKPLLSEEQLRPFKNAVSNAEKVLVIVGQQSYDTTLSEAVGRLSKLDQVLVMTETTSNIKHGDRVTCIDRLIMTFDDDDENDFIPDLLITVGGQIISKKIKALLRRKFKGAHWHISQTVVGMDTFQRLTNAVACDPAFFVNALSDRNHQSTYHTRYYDLHTGLSSLEIETAEALGWSDLLVFRHLTKRIPSGSILQMGNSSVVRYIQLFDERDDLRYFGNRGTSGIDGCTSTASGMASVAEENVTLISGDIAFLYDINGLWHQTSRDKLRIVVINNGGGNIFRIIDGPSGTDASETVFEAAHQQDVSLLARHFGIDYQEVHSAEALDASLKWLYEGEQCKLIEVFTREVANEDVLKQSFRDIKQHLKSR